MRGSVARRFVRRPSAVAAALALALLVAASLAAPAFEARWGVSGIKSDLANRLREPGVRHLLGTDQLGRDDFARLMRGGGLSLAIALAGAALATLIGVCAGAAAAGRGMLGRALTPAIDVFIALPALPILMTLSAVDLGKLGFAAEEVRSGLAPAVRLVVLLALFAWPEIAHLTRRELVALREREFVRAAYGLGAGEPRVIRVHLLPHALASVLVAAFLLVGRLIMAESALSFLGLGIEAPLVSWGAILNETQHVLGAAPLKAIVPGLLIAGAIIAVQAVGEGLRRALDPRSEPGAGSPRQPVRHSSIQSVSGP